MARVRADRVRLAERIPNAREVVDRLSRRYSDSALAQIGGNPEEIEQLLDFAVHTAAVSERRGCVQRSVQADAAAVGPEVRHDAGREVLQRVVAQHLGREAGWPDANLVAAALGGPRREEA